jgi:hypothetical protein
MQLDTLYQELANANVLDESDRHIFKRNILNQINELKRNPTYSQQQVHSYVQQQVPRSKPNTQRHINPVQNAPRLFTSISRALNRSHWYVNMTCEQFADTNSSSVLNISDISPTGHYFTSLINSESIILHTHMQNLIVVHNTDSSIDDEKKPFVFKEFSQVLVKPSYNDRCFSSLNITQHLDCVEENQIKHIVLAKKQKNFISYFEGTLNDKMIYGEIYQHESSSDMFILSFHQRDPDCNHRHFLIEFDSRLRKMTGKWYECKNDYDSLMYTSKTSVIMPPQYFREYRNKVLRSNERSIDHETEYLRRNDCVFSDMEDTQSIFGTIRGESYADQNHVDITHEWNAELQVKPVVQEWENYQAVDWESDWQ